MDRIITGLVNFLWGGVIGAVVLQLWLDGGRWESFWVGLVGLVVSVVGTIASD